MNCNPTLTADEFKVLHNSLWELGCIDNPKVQELVERIRSVALKGAYEQDNDAFDSKFSYFNRFQTENNLRAVWSIYETTAPGGFLENHPYPSDVFVVYKDHWGGKTVHCAVQGSTWADIYRAADHCIRNSGDDHHVFIEHFELKNGNELYLTTGS